MPAGPTGFATTPALVDRPTVRFGSAAPPSFTGTRSSASHCRSEPHQPGAPTFTHRGPRNRGPRSFTGPPRWELHQPRPSKTAASKLHPTAALGASPASELHEFPAARAFTRRRRTSLGRSSELHRALRKVGLRARRVGEIFARPTH